MNTLYHKSKPRQGSNKFFDTREKRLYQVPYQTRKTGFHRERLARKCMLQIQEEGVHTYGYVHSEYWDIYKRGVLRKNGIRYRSFPQRVATVVVSALGDHELPDSDVEQLRLITQWIAAIPDEKQIGGNNDFGGKYAGLTFPSCEPGRNIKIEPGMSVEFIAYVMDCDEVEYRVHGEGFVILNMDEDDARRYVDENFSQV